MFLDYLPKIFEICIIPLLGIITTYLIKLIKAKGDKIKEDNKNDFVDKCIDRVIDIIDNCVIETNQTFVENMKDRGQFDLTAQKEAFDRTLNTVKGLLTEQLAQCLMETYGDLDKFLTSQIESSVNLRKL